MAHETLKALYEADVEAFGREKANAFWEYRSEGSGFWTSFDSCGYPSWFINSEYRRRPDAPWPWGERIKELEAKLEAVEMQAAAYASNSAEWQRLREKEKANNTNEWPVDAPENANYMLVSFHEFCPEVKSCLSFTLLKRPQPPKRKIDWSQLAPWVMEYWKPTFGRKLNESGWIPWNVPGCRDDMEGRGCPVPDGVVVEIISANGVFISGNSEEFDWSDFSDTKRPIVAFSITGITDGWE